ncbi:MAG: glycosyltransferase family 2 protein [Rhodospirillales bacterium]|nr:glycosyltransferase family 2 protein [Rhodospirillales bacterium]
MTVAPRASIVIRALNEGKYLGPLFEALKRQSDQSFEVILVDSGSSDRSVAIAEEHGVRIEHIRPENFTFGRSLNYGCRVARGEFLVLLSAHTLPMHEDWLAELLHPFEDERVKVSYGMQRGGKENKFSECCMMQSWFPETDIPSQTDYFCNNANCAIRRADWERRPYDESLTGLEDLAWAKEAVQEGGLVAYSAKGGIYHIHQETWDRVRKRYYREALAFQNIEPDAYFRLSDLLRYSSLNILNDLKCALSRGALRSMPEIFLFRINQARGIYRACAERKVRGSRGTETASTQHLKDRFYHPSPNYGFRDCIPRKGPAAARLERNPAIRRRA